MKDRLKKALKRGASGLLALLLVVCLVGTPRAKAVVSEGALLGSIFGTLLVSMGYSWAAENMDIPTFGESIYKLTQEFDEAMKDTGNQLIRDLNLAGLTANGAGKLQFGYAWVQAARSFAQWFQEKFFTSEETTVEVSPSTTGVYLADGEFLQFGITDVCKGQLLMVDTIYTLSNGLKFGLFSNGSFRILKFYGQDDALLLSIEVGQYGSNYSLNYNPANGFFDIVWNCSTDGVNWDLPCKHRYDIFDSKNSALVAAGGIPLVVNGSLVAEKPQEVHYPVVAEDGSEVYEITVDGVTATDIEGIIQGAVDRILAGTATIVGSVEQAGTGEEVANPEIGPYKVSLSSVFPFCIPFDVYNMVTLFVSEPEAPHAEWTFTLPWGSQEYSVGWDLAAFDGVARVCRDLQLVLFAVGLAVITYKVIKW